jgi:pilus assembly protein CpaE
VSTFVLAFPDERFRSAVSELVGAGAAHSFDDPAALADLAALCQQLVRPDTEVVTVGPDIDADEALAVISELDRRFPALSVVLVHRPTADLWQAALLAGARDIIDPDADLFSIEVALDRAADRAHEQRESLRRNDSQVAPPQASIRRIVTIASPKGGSGKTVVATNLAVFLARQAPGEVVLVDLDLQFGDVASALGLTPSYTMYTATQASGNEASLLKAFLTPHSSQLLVLCAPEDPTESDDVKEGDAVRIVVELSKQFRWVIVDTGAGLDDLTLSVAEVSTDVVLVSSTDVLSVRGVRKEAAIMDQLGIRATRHLVLNRSDARVGLSPNDISETIGLSIVAEVPSSRSIPTSVNIGVPVIEHDARSPAARGLAALGSRLLEGGGKPAAAKSWRNFLR